VGHLSLREISFHFSLIFYIFICSSRHIIRAKVNIMISIFGWDIILIGLLKPLGKLFVFLNNRINLYDLIDRNEGMRGFIVGSESKTKRIIIRIIRLN
jgi:hypothetical protein